MPAVSLWILVSGFLFTLMSMSAKICANYFTLFEILFWRSLFGVVCVASLMIYQGVPFPTKHPMAHIKRCVAGILCFLLEIWALCYLPLSVEQPISYLSPLLFCSFFVISSRRTGDRIDWPVIGAVVLGFIGVLFIARPSAEGFNATGVVLAILSAFAGASTNWFLRSLGEQGEPSERAVFYFMLMGLLTGIIGIFFSPEPFHIPHGKWVWPLTGVMTTGIVAQVISTYAWAKGHSLLNAVFQFFGIFFCIVIGVAVLGENPDMTTIFGAVLIFVAGLFSSLYLRKVR